MDDRFQKAHDRIASMRPDFPEGLVNRLPMTISDLDVHALAVEEGWQDVFLRGGPSRTSAPPASQNIRNMLAPGAAGPPKLPPVPKAPTSVLVQSKAAGVPAPTAAAPAIAPVPVALSPLPHAPAVPLPSPAPASEVAESKDLHLLAQTQRLQMIPFASFAREAWPRALVM